MGKEVDFVGNGAGEVGEGFADIGRVVVGFVVVLGGYGEQLLVHRLKSVDAFLERDVVGREFGLWWGRWSASIWRDIEVGGKMFGGAVTTLPSAVPICSLKYCCVRAANDEEVDLVLC